MRGRQQGVRFDGKRERGRLDVPAARDAPQLARERDEAARAREAAVGERDQVRDNLVRLMGAAAQSTEALAKATDELTASRARAGALEAELGRVRGAQIDRPGNGHDASAIATARELAAVEAGLRDELAALAKIERALADELADTEAPSAPASKNDRGLSPKEHAAA